MKNFTKLFACLFFLPALALFSNAQNVSEEWIRVQSDNGEFSIEIPKKYSYFYDKDGFWASHDYNDYKLKNMSLLNSYSDQTLLSFEVYEVNKNALNSFIEDDKRDGTYSEFVRGNVKIKQIVKKTDKFYLVRQYFNSKKFIYVLTAASKQQETENMKRFFNSLKFNLEKSPPVDANITSFSQLEITKVVLKSAQPAKSQSVSPPASPSNADNPNKLLVVHKPRAAYVDSARMKQVQGTVTFKIEFSVNGFTPKLDILHSLPEGLSRQALFSALRIKFFPQIENGIAVNTDRILQYTFTIY